MDAEPQDLRARLVAIKIAAGYAENTKLRRLPKVTRAKALSSHHNNGRIGEIAGLYMPRSAHRRVSNQKSKVTGVSSGGLVNLPAFEDRT